MASGSSAARASSRRRCSSRDGARTNTSSASGIASRTASAPCTSSSSSTSWPAASASSTNCAGRALQVAVDLEPLEEAAGVAELLELLAGDEVVVDARRLAGPGRRGSSTTPTTAGSGSCSRSRRPSVPLPAPDVPASTSRTPRLTAAGCEITRGSPRGRLLRPARLGEDLAPVLEVVDDAQQTLALLVADAAEPATVGDVEALQAIAWRSPCRHRAATRARSRPSASRACCRSRRRGRSPRTTRRDSAIRSSACPSPRRADGARLRPSRARADAAPA